MNFGWRCVLRAGLALLVASATCSVGFGASMQVDLDPKQYKHITFDDITPTKYRSAKVGSSTVLAMDVASSCSFLLLPFAEAKAVKQVDVDWRVLPGGKLGVKSPEHEASKDGDDSFFRLGLVLKGDAPSIPFFAPAWIKAIRDTMKLPTDQLQYLVFGSQHKAGGKWESPYSDSMKMLAVDVTGPKDADGWQKTVTKLNLDKSVVGLWLMADGDNTKGKFESQVKSIVLH